MPQLEELTRMYMAKGCRMRILVDQDAPPDSVDKYQTEVVYDGHPDSDVFYVLPHWHKYHDEHIKITEGRISVTVEGKKTILNAGDEAVFIPRWHVHSMSGFKGERAVMIERTTPTGEFKGLFFNDLFSSGSPGFLHSMRANFDGDSYISLPGNVKFIDQIFTYVFGALAKTLLFFDRKSMAFNERRTQ